MAIVGWLMELDSSVGIVVVLSGWNREGELRMFTGNLL